MVGYHWYLLTMCQPYLAYVRCECGNNNYPLLICPYFSWYSKKKHAIAACKAAASEQSISIGRILPPEIKERNKISIRSEHSCTDLILRAGNISMTVPRRLTILSSFSPICSSCGTTRSTNLPRLSFTRKEVLWFRRHSCRHRGHEGLRVIHSARQL